MIDFDAQLKLQAWLDGELPEAEAAEVKAWVERDAEARALVAELRNTAGALTGNEPEIKLPESREFFWSKIQREIERQEAPARPAAARWSLGMWLRRVALPLSGVATVALALGLMLAKPKPVQAEPESDETEVASDTIGASTYRDDEHHLTMVWVYDMPGKSGFTTAAPLDSVDLQ
jgi:anti-sigma factor RsiW